MSDTLEANTFGLDGDDLDDLLEPPEQDFDELLDESDSLDIDALLDEVGLSDDELDDLFEQVANQQLDLPEGEWWP